MSGNSAAYGGGIYSASFSDLGTTVLNSTISGNDVYALGGGLFIEFGLTRIVHSTITDNQASSGGGVLSLNDNVTRTDVKGSLIWGNGGNDVDAFSEPTNRFNSLGHNLIGTAGDYVDFSLEFNQTGDQTGVEAGTWLGPLSPDNGGPTATHALLTGSPAINTGTCTDHLNNPVTTDQRGAPRPTTGCDIGAFELEVATPSQLLESLITLSASTPGVSKGTQAKLIEARQHLAAGRIGPACNKLREYIDDVQNQRGKKISTADANLLIARAAEIRAALGC